MSSSLAVTTLISRLIDEDPLSVLRDEEAARVAFVHLRYPEGPRCDACGRALTQEGLRLHCACGASRALLAGTPFAHLRRPSLRVILCGAAYMARSPQGIAARVLAARTGLPPTSVWRHLQLVRGTLPIGDVSRLGVKRPTFGTARVCKKRECATVAAAAFRSILGLGVFEDDPPPDRGSGAGRLIAQTIRTWLNGTHHGVTARWLHLYVREQMSRFTNSPLAILLGAFAPSQQRCACPSF